MPIPPSKIGEKPPSRPGGRPRILSENVRQVQVQLEPEDLEIVRKWGRAIGEKSLATTIRDMVRRIGIDYELK